LDSDEEPMPDINEPDEDEGLLGRTLHKEAKDKEESATELATPMEQRLDRMEKHLNVSSTRDRSMPGRMAALENRIIELEREYRELQARMPPSMDEDGVATTTPTVKVLRSAAHQQQQQDDSAILNREQNTVEHRIWELKNKLITSSGAQIGQ
jgi:hypothetical protein